MNDQTPFRKKIPKYFVLVNRSDFNNVNSRYLTYSNLFFSKNKKSKRYGMTT